MSATAAGLSRDQDQTHLRALNGLLLLAAAIVLLVLIGWTFRIEALKRIVPGATSMNPVTAVSLGAAALALWLRRRPGPLATIPRTVATLATLVVITIALLKLIDVFFGTHLCPDELLFTSQLDVGQATRSRIAPNAAAALLFLGLAIASLDVRRSLVAPGSRVLLLPTVLLALAAIIGYLYDTSSFYAVKNFIPMALHTAVVLLLLSLATLYARPTSGITGVVLADTPGGRIARQLLPACIVIPTLLGWLELRGQLLGRYGLGTGTTLLVLAIIVVIGGLVILVSHSLHRVELQRRAIAAALEVRLAEQAAAAHWSERLAELDEIARDGDDDLHTNAERLLRTVLAAVSAPVGLIHRVRTSDEDSWLDAYVAQACSTPLPALKPQRIGSGLAGQCAKTRQAITIDQLPADYFRLRTAIVDLPLSHLLLLPIEIGQDCVGVLELASLKPFDEAERHFLDRSLRVLAYVLFRVRSAAQAEPRHAHAAI